MKFTSNIPTEPGFYLYRKDSNSPHILGLVTQWKNSILRGFLRVEFSDASMGSVGSFDGEWCELVPKDELEEIRASFGELRECARDLADALKLEHHENEGYLRGGPHALARFDKLEESKPTPKNEMFSKEDLINVWDEAREFTYKQGGITFVTDWKNSKTKKLVDGV